MKKLLFLFIVFSFFGCEERKLETSNVGKILEGNHELRRFKVTTEKGETWSASYFLIAGGASSRSYNETKASFSWKMNSGEYAISQIELGRIRIKIDNKVKIPYVKFHWDRGNSTDLESIFNYYVNYMIITCSEEDYPINININQL